MLIVTFPVKYLVLPGSTLHRILQPFYFFWLFEKSDAIVYKLKVFDIWLQRYSDEKIKDHILSVVSFNQSLFSLYYESITEIDTFLVFSKTFCKNEFRSYSPEPPVSCEKKTFMIN